MTGVKFGFTGTQDGTTCEQHTSLVRVLKESVATEFHYGCCVGADEEAADIIHELVPKPKIIGHPPTNRKKMSRWCEYVCNDMAPAEPYLIRNGRIVEAVDEMIACPKGEEELRSGTWATIRFARKCGKPVTIIWPDGSVEKET